MEQSDTSALILYVFGMIVGVFGMSALLRSIDYQGRLRDTVDTVATIMKFFVCYGLAIMVACFILDRGYSLGTKIVALVLDSVVRWSCIILTYLAEQSFAICFAEPLC